MFSQRKSSRASRMTFLGTLAAVVLTVALCWAIRVSKKGGKSPAQPFAAYAKSPSCKSCHQQVFRLWENSHHALAERPINLSLDWAAFEPPHQIRHGSQNSETR